MARGDGLAAERKKQRDRDYYAANRETIIARAVAHQIENKDKKNANNRKWAKANRPKMREAVNKWRAEHPEETKAQVDRMNERAVEQHGMLYATAYHRLNRAKAMLSSSKYRAKRRGLEHTITIDDVVIPDCCPVFGFPLDTALGSGRSDQSPSLDRIDNTRGYVKDNVMVVSWLANRIKNDATPEQLRIVANYYGEKAKALCDISV